MRQIIASRPARKLILILFIVTLTTGGLYYANDADARVYRVRSSSSADLEPALGDESKILYSIPQDAKEGLYPGLTVSKLPSGCSTKYTSSLTYHDCSGVYFRQVYKGNKLAYMVIERP